MILEPIHFIGIGGIGMSAVAQALLEKGYRVSGSDLRDNPNTQRLEELGAKITIGHGAENIQGAQTVVISTAVAESNPELAAARKENLRILHRSEMLAEVMSTAAERICIAGTHGKTTTTTMMAALFEQADLNPTVINGGVMNAYGSNAKVGDSELFIVESDESDGSFTRFHPTVAVISNIDPEHMDHYGDFDSLMRSFENFAENTSPDGGVVLGIDHANVRLLKERLDHPWVTTFGFVDDAHFRAVNLRSHPEGMTFDVLYKDESYITDMQLKAFGVHNVLNALAVIAVGYLKGISVEDIALALAKYQGVQRRFTPVGTWNRVTVIDDYAHHPVEIEATLQAAKTASQGKVIAVVQPHRYSRLQNHFDEFATSCEMATFTIILPVFPAGEEPIPGIDHQHLAESMPGCVTGCDNPDELASLVSRLASPGDMVVCMGAGSISTISRKLPEQLQEFVLPEARSA